MNKYRVVTTVLFYGLLAMTFSGIFIIGCAKPPDTAPAKKALKDAEWRGDAATVDKLKRMLEVVEADLKFQETRLFKNYDKAKELLDGIVMGKPVDVSVEVRKDEYPADRLKAVCLDGYKFAYSTTNGDIAAFIDERGRGVPCQ